MIDILLAAALILCILIAAALAVAEVSLLRVRRTQVVAAAQAGAPRARHLLALLDDLPVVLNIVLLLVLFTQVGAATISAYLAGRWFGGIGLPVVSVLLTTALFVYGEAIPKTRAVRDPQRNALRVEPALRVAVGLLRRPVGLLLRVVDVQTSGDAPLDVATEAELRLLARQAAAGGAIEPSDAHLVERSFRFGDLRVRDIMVPRDRIRFVRAEETVEVGLARALAFGHRRLPVVRTTLDDVIGVVRLRDLAAAAGDTKTDTLATALLRCAPSDSIDDVLANMQHHRCKVAIVANGAGRTVGLLTIEDIVGELVGDIADDH